jgi:hypothetical protein
MRLADFSRDDWTQFGEDGMLEHVFELIGEGGRFCVEFGAADGLSCSNTKRLRDLGWNSVLIESDPTLFALLKKEENLNTRVVQRVVTAKNVNNLFNNKPIDFISIDVDGGDYDIFEAIDGKPRVVCIEYNATVPPHLSLRQSGFGGFGASAKAICDLAESKGYGLVGLTKGNLIFVYGDEIAKFSEFDRDLADLFDASLLSYLVTDYGGRSLCVGAVPPWGIKPIPFVGDTLGCETFLTMNRVDVLCEAFEALYGEALFINRDSNINVEVPDEHRQKVLSKLLERTRGLIVMDISHHQPDADFAWIKEKAEAFDYNFRSIPSGVIALFRGRVM